MAFWASATACPLAWPPGRPSQMPRGPGKGAGRRRPGYRQWRPRHGHRDLAALAAVVPAIDGGSDGEILPPSQPLRPVAGAEGLDPAAPAPGGRQDLAQLIGIDTSRQNGGGAALTTCLCTCAVASATRNESGGSTFRGGWNMSELRLEDSKTRSEF